MHHTAHNAATRNRQLGFNLIEATIVLSIVGIVLAGVFAAWSSISSQQRIRKASDLTTVIVQQVRNAYGTRSGFAASDTAATAAQFTTALINSGLIPVENVAGTTITNPWGGTLTVLADSAQSITLTFSNVSAADCSPFANNILNATRTQGLTQIDGQAVTTATTYAAIRANICTTTTLALRFSLKVN